MSVEYLEDFSEPLVLGMVKAQPIIYRYEMPNHVEEDIRSIQYNFGYGGFSEAVYYRTYSQLKSDGTKEDFPDTIIRVVKGVVSIAKDWKVKHGLEWDQKEWDNIAVRLGKAMMKMQLLPPGRGLWSNGTEYCYERGSVALNNCGFCSLNEGIVKAATWTVDSLMCGCGIGFSTDTNGEFENINLPGCDECRSIRNVDEIGKCDCKKRIYKIHDSREGWTKSIYLLLLSYFDNTLTIFDYSNLRPEGELIKGFGGTSSGPEPLRILHERIRLFFKCFIETKRLGAYEAIYRMTKEHIKIYPLTNFVEKPSLEYALSQLENMPDDLKLKKTYGSSRLICDIFNAIGICVVAGNVRRSSEIALGSASDLEFLDLKNYELNPERCILGWMSNNTVCLDKTEDFDMLPEIAKRIKDNGEPGIYNRLNSKRYGRIGRREPIGREAEEDKASGQNPCCISGDSMISTSEGLICVRDLVGKQFKARFDNINDLVDADSTECGFWSNGVKEVFELKLKNGFSVKTTKDHRIAIYDEKVRKGMRWVELQNIDIDNDVVMAEYENSKIESIEFVGEEEVFDCTIPYQDSFYANGILVHNCEIPLESYEYCNLAEIFPTRCNTYEEMEEAAILATIYTSTVSLLPTHWSYSNAVIARNRRVGVSISGITEQTARTSVTDFIKKCRALYKVVRKTNQKLAKENGVPESLRCTTVKPSGTISQLVGVSSGVHHNTYKYCIRRMRMNANVKLTQQLKDAGYQHEIDKKAGEGTIIFSFPLHQGEARTAEEVSVWEQASNLSMMQREWSDNSVSCTLYFNPKTEGHDLEHVLAQYAPLIKSLSCLPHTEEGVYEQAPYEKITKEKYEEMLASIKPINIAGNDDIAVFTRGCDGDSCDIASYLANSKKD